MQKSVEKPVFGDAVDKYNWLILADALRLSFTPACLLIAFIGVVASVLGWQFSGALFRPVAAQDLEGQHVQRFHDQVARWPGSVRPADGVGRIVNRIRQRGRQSKDGFQTIAPVDPLMGVPYRMIEPFRRLLQPGRSWSSLGYYLFGALFSLVVWAFCGGAITRTSAIRHATGVQISLKESLEFAFKNWAAFFSAPALPLVGIVMIALPFFLIGWLMRFDMVLPIASVLWIFVLAGGLLMAVLSLGLAFGWPLMWGAVGTETSDAFDAISRAYAYTFQRPLHYVFYAFIAAVLGALGWMVAWWFSEAIVQTSLWSISWGCGLERFTILKNAMGGRSGEELSAGMFLGTRILSTTIGTVRIIATAFSWSYVWCVAGSLYLLLRKATDHQDIDDVAVGEKGMTNSE